MNPQTSNSGIDPLQTAARRRPGALEHGQLLLTVLGIFIGAAYIARALLTA